MDGGIDLKKKQTVKRAAFLIGAILYTLAGCVKQTDTPIVSETMEGAQEPQKEESIQGEKKGEPEGRDGGSPQLPAWLCVVSWKPWQG